MTSQPPSSSSSGQGSFELNPFETIPALSTDMVPIDDSLRQSKTGTSTTAISSDDDVVLQENDMMDTEISSDSSPQRETMRITDAFSEPSTAIASVTQVPSYYVHGVVQGVHAYLVTNLMGGESETLLQPQMVWTLGRNRQVAILLRDSGLSRRHAVIQYVTRQGFYIIDLNSMNGSFVNGVRLRQKHLLEDGDRVSLGNTSFIFYTSCRNRTLEPIHPEVLSYLNNAGSFSMPVSS